MVQTAELYGIEYHRRIEIEETRQAERLAHWIKSEFTANPEQTLRVTDFGCSTGIYVRELRSVGIEAIGVDNSRAAIENAVCGHVREGDITGYCDCIGFAEIGLCLEVAEHIESEKADDMIRCLIRHTKKTIIFSAAQPGQGGVGHVNLQPKSFWIEKFERRGWVVDYIGTREFLMWLAGDQHMGWLMQNAMIMRPIRRA